MALMLTNQEIILRLVLAIFLGGLIGLERQIAHKTAGLRTFSLVSLGSCLITTVSVWLYSQSMASFNIAIIPANIITGIGFLGAGIIIFHGVQPKGITTAAGLWVAAAVGMAVGFGFYSAAIFTSFLTVLIFTVFWLIEVKIIKKIEI